MRTLLLALLVLISAANPAFAVNQCDDSRYRVEAPARIEVARHPGEFKGQPIGETKEFVVYLDKGNKQNHYIPSGWIGDYGDIKLNDQFAEKTQSGTTCIEFIYSAKKTQGQGWAGVYWQNRRITGVQNWGVLTSPG